jgi:hypothetical protein
LLKEFMMSEGDFGADGRDGAPVADWAALIKGTQDKVAKSSMSAESLGS